MRTSIRIRLQSLLGFLILLRLFSPQPAQGCEESCWHHGKLIVVESGTIAQSIRSGCGNDTILVESGAQVVSEGTDATGIDSGNGNDSVTNEGSISVVAAEAQAAGEKDAGGGHCGLHWKHNWFDADADATAIGIQAGNGQDSVLNTGSIDVTASSQLTDSGTARSLAIGIDGGNGNDSSESFDSAVASESAGASISVEAVSTASLSGNSWELVGRHAADRSVDTEATAYGIIGGNGKDSIGNDATLTVSAQSDITVAETSATLLEVRDANMSIRGSALAVGIDGGNGNDQITNQGDLAVTATSTIETDSIAVTDIEAARGHDTEFDGSITATAKAVGITTGNSCNETVDIGNTSTITVQATSSIDADSFALTLADVGSSTDTSLTAIAGASGIVGGHGKDTIANEGTLTVGASASVDSLALELSLLDMGSADTSIQSSATAVGIEGGHGKDTIVNLGDISVTAESSVKTNGLAVAGVSGLPWVHDAEFDGSTTATAAATGISTGSSCDEALGIGNTSTITVQATSSVDAGSYSLTLADLASTIDTSLTAIADASGIVGGHGKDTIANEGTLTVGATADIDSISVELNLVDIAKSKADLDAQASAVGIDSGSGNDSLQNSGTLSAGATANTESWSAEFSAVDIATGDFSSSTTAEAVGIASGQGTDAITNSGSITADATAEILMGDFSMSLVDLTPLADLDFLGLDTAGDGSTTVEAEATGVSSGCQDDTITSSGSITAKATTEATRIGVEVGAEGLPEGLFTGEIASLENLASADVSLSSEATGIDGGTGDDEITNQGSITADASATSWGGSLSLSLPLLDLPFPSPFPAFSLVDAGMEVNAEATGIQGGQGDELIRNEGELDIDASASALNVAASIGFQGSVDDIAIAVTRVDALTEAEAAASGIEGGEGDDQILNSGDITVDAVAQTLTVGANVAVQNKAAPEFVLPIDLQGTLADVRATTAADASGILGGEGEDAITSSGDITVSADSSNAGVGLSASVVCEAEKGLVVDGAAVKADTTATAKAAGIEGGEGEDAIHNSGTVEVSAEARSLSAAVALTYQGSSSKALGLQAALATVTTTSEATAEGLAGGTENDLIVNEGALNVAADSQAYAASIAVDIMPGKKPGIGISLANAQNQATAAATGISGGEGDDRISNSGALTVEADSTAVAASVSVTRQGAAGSGTLDPASFDSGNTAEAVAKAIDGGAGNEIICNTGALDVDSTAVAPSVGVAVSSKGVSAAITTADASASSTGIDTGEGTHWVHNTGAITADSTAVAAGVSVSVAGEGLAAGIDTIWDGGTTATAAAAGIHAESGNDAIMNEGAITTTSAAVAPSVDVAVTGKGVSVGISTATAEARSAGIDAGAGDDWIDNSGAITSTSVANADAISVDISGKGVAGSGNDVWDGGVEAAANAKGIDAGAGSNTVVNTGSIAADATATTVSAGVSIVGKGLSASVSTATATAKAVGIDPGETTPELWNSGDITSTATATAVTVNADIAGKGVAAALDEIWDGGTQATATARGIEAGAVNNNIWNEGAITAGSEATTPSVGVAVAGKGLSAAVTTSTATADSVGIDTREGDDVVANSGAISATADAEAYAISAAVAGKGVAVAGDAVWDGGTTALARAAGIATGVGNDSIYNAADILADSSATTVAAGVSVAGEGITAAVSTSTAEAQASGIAAGEGSDWVETTGDIAANASSTAVTAIVDVTGKGIAVAADAVWDGGTRSTAVAKGIETGTASEDDTILSKGDISATSDAVTVSAGVSVAGKGLSAATTTSTTTAQAAGIDAGAGNDAIQSEGNITADASATGVSVAAAITGTGISGAADAVWDGGTHTTAGATGIHAGDGDDSILSTGDITATSDAVTVAADVAITGTGLSLATSTATTTAQATGIDAGAGNDVIQSEGAITADASATGVAVAASITGTGLSGAADAVWDGGTHTTAAATGIAAGDGDDSVSSIGDITATSSATTVAADVAITGTGLSLATSTATTTAQATGIDAGTGNDVIQSEGAITADASATGVAVAASITGTGLSGAADAVWDGGTHTTAVAKGIDAGAGIEDDTVISIGDITATSSATTVAADVAITGTGVSLSTSTATTTAQAVGIDGGAGNDTIQSEGAILADSTATGVAVAASITGTGLSGAADAVWDGGTHTSALATGISVGEGDDSILSKGDISANSDATTVAVDAAITGAGVSLATSTATTAALSTGIDAGAGNDTIQSDGAILADSTATGVAVAASITGVGVSGAADAVWDGGTETIAGAIGINAGAGDDVVKNTGILSATAEATTVAVDVGITAKGVGLATSTSATTALASGIDAGAGNDLIQNTAGISSDASASGVGVAAGLTAFGVSGATDALWDSGTSATAIAEGIAGGAGDDAISNTGNILVTAEADTVAVDAAVTAAGISAAMTNTTVEARAIGIDGGEGADSIANQGAITGSADANALGVGVSLSGIGGSATAADIWEDGISGEAVFAGIEAGFGNDTIVNSGAISGTSKATTPAISVSVTGIGFGAALNTATADAQTTGIGGGEGDDTILNTGAISAAATADADTVAVTVSGVGAAFAGDQWGQNTLATATAIGIDGGAGNDAIQNTAAIAATAVAESDATAVTVTLAGYADSEAENTSAALAAGISGAQGNDTIDNSGGITTHSTATADAGNVEVNLAGASTGEAGSTALAVGTAIDGGAGDDTIRNSGNLSITSGATTDASSVNVVLAGYGDTDADNLAAALAMGIAGGEGNDTISNTGNITLISGGTAEAGSVSIGLAGAVFGKAGTTASAAAVALDGGAGADVIQNSGAIDGKATSFADSSSTGVELAGSVDSSAECISVAEAIGIRAGDGDDTIGNSATGSITLTSTATSEADGVQVGLFGAAKGQAGTKAIALATAIDGGAGNDMIRSDAPIDVTATTSTTADSTTVEILGSGQAGVDTSAVTIAQGIAGGDGADRIENTGNVSVISSATMSLDAYGFTFGGTSVGQGTLTADGSSVGIAGGSGSDAINNQGQIYVKASSTMSVEGDSDVAFGTASAGADTTAATNAVGIDAGEGDDAVKNGESITVISSTTMTLNNSSFSFGGTAASGEGAMSASTRAVGISGGDGSDAIHSDGAITVKPSTALSALSGSDVAFGSSDAGTTITASTQGTGIDAGAGDDTVLNMGGIAVGYYNSDVTDAMTKIDVSGSTWSFGGTGSVSAAALARGSSTGIDAGSGDDVIRNEAYLEVNSTAYAKTQGSGYTFAGSSASSGAVTAEANAVGIQGGEGRDTIANSSLITVRARSRTDSLGSVETTFGSSKAYAGAASSAAAVGIDGQAGDEVLENSGTIDVSADAYAFGSTNSTVFWGNPSATSVTTVAAAATGIDAGAGDNSIDNQGLISAAATATSDPDATADSDIASNLAASYAGVSAAAAGISAREGDDVIANGDGGSIVATTTAIAIPYAHSDENSTASGVANSTAFGIQAGDGDNRIDNLGVIQATAGATVEATGVSRSLTIYAKSAALANATVQAAGIAAGQGDDEITNSQDGAITVSATTTGTAKATPRPNEGEHNEGSSATVGLAAEATGIYAGSGTDTITNLGLVEAAATAAATAYAKSNTDITSNAATADAVASANASGISAGNGADTILNEQGAGITATATTTVSTGADSDENSKATGAANAAALGIGAGDGYNTITNLGSIQATAGATITATTVAASHTDTAHSTASPTADAQAAGISASQGTDIITNGEDGEITVRAAATGTATAMYDDTHLDHANATVGLSATASGISSGNGDNTIDNFGSIDVDALVQANADARADTNVAANWGTANSTTAAAAYGISAGSGSDTILNGQGASITATAAAVTTPGAPTGVSAFARSDEHATATGNFQATALGIEAGDGDNTITNLGGIEATSGATVTATTIASSNTMTAHSTAGVTAAADAAGITAGHGNDVIANGEQGQIKASATATGTAVGTYFAEHMDIATATAGVSATASGIAAGAGENTIENRGLIDVDALAQAYTVARASTSTADTYSTANSTATAVARGISAAGGDNTIENYGVIDARAEAQATADAYSHTDWWGDEHTSMSTTKTARAYGIQALDGSNTIINYGTIISTAVGSDAQAFGIQTGGGDDLVVNNGTITTTVNGTTTTTSKGGDSRKGVGIDTGAGNDQVVFGDGSYIGCELYLGEGNDGLTVIGSGTISGNVYGGDGLDALRLDGATNFNLDQTFDFESLAKLGSSTVSLNNAQMLEQLDVFEGVLQINNSYQFTDTGAFSAKVYGGGDCGQLLVTGDLGLDGTMTVVRGPGAYLDGATYEVLTAGSLSGNFDSIVLPGASPLLRFGLTDTGNNGYRVTASTEAFASVATNGIEQAVSKCLDSIVASAEGDLSLVLGEIQAMQSDGYSTAFSSLSPDSYACSTRTTFSAADQFSQVLSNRLRNLRLPSPQRLGDGGLRPRIQRTGYGIRSGRSVTPERMADYGLWLSGFGQWGGFAASDGYTGFDFDLYGTTLGYDRYLGRGLTAGVSLGYANTQVYYDGSKGGGLTNSVTGSAYGSYATGRLHLDTALSYGRQSYENSRTIEVGEVLRTAASDHGSNALLAYLGGGLTLGRQPWTIEPLASVQYVYLNEEGFTEQGAGSVSLNVQERTAHSLVSDLGLRLGLSLDFGRRALASELFAAWRHDFAADPGTITASFVDAPDALFAISGPETAKNGVLLGASLLLRDSERFSAAVKYSLEVGGQYRANSLSGEIQYGF